MITHGQIKHVRMLSGEYRSPSRSRAQTRQSVSKEKGNQTVLPNEVTFVYPTQTINQYEYHEIPVKIENSDTKCRNKVRFTRSRSNSKHQSGSPLSWQCTNKNDYSWTTQTLNNYDNYYDSTTTVYNKTKNNLKKSNAGKPPVAEIYYSYETVRPKTSADHFYGTKPDYYYYEVKPQVNFDKSTSTQTSNAQGTQTFADKGAARSLEFSRDALNKYNVYIK